jgi:hypothetical protein
LPDHRKKEPAMPKSRGFGQQLRDLAVRCDRMAVAVEKKPVNHATAEHTATFCT